MWHHPSIAHEMCLCPTKAAPWPIPKGLVEVLSSLWHQCGHSWLGLRVAELCWGMQLRNEHSHSTALGHHGRVVPWGLGVLSLEKGAQATSLFSTAPKRRL